MPATKHRSIRAKTGALLCFFIAIATSSLISEQAFAQATGNRATFPKNFKEYVLYGSYDRGSSKEEAFATAETIAISKSGKPLPPGTQLVLGIWTDYKLVSYFVMEKGFDWGLSSPEELRTGDWHFQQFDLNGQVKREAIADRCQSCHGSQADSDFMFTIDKMRAYLP
ncbi:cytochrome P460 family protein (plasmid) [Rhizobium lusitanum]|uniref:cytochrome P460 family protein n=1 Tax=Rhizobium lusitanum TaxID=293958 RepID=UPI0016201A48|nr:cytochrome P460 family protein [Rhizobium lusitanum]QND46072.1 cytochrome P460 family protein [Rhizobium lusitanum]